MSESSNNPPKMPPKIDYAPSKSWRDHFASERRWLGDAFSREKVIDAIKQLAWVVPLTLLIWVYAEREQIETRRNETIPFKLVSVDPNKTVALAPRQDSNVVVELQGPRARVQSVLQGLRGGEALQGLRLELDRNLSPGEHVVPTAALVANNPAFTQNGITVTRCQPERLNVVVDSLVEREARVLPPPGVTTLNPTTRFDPAQVKVRGPATVLDRARLEGGVLPVYVRIPDELLRTPGEKEPRKLSLELPPALNDDDRVTLVGRTDVDATLNVRSSDEPWEMQAMTITVDQPKLVAERFTVDYNPSLPAVTLIGPKDIIDSMRTNPNFEPKPYAQLKVSGGDVGGPVRRKLRFVDLPPGVRVSDKDMEREVSFTLKPKSDVDQ